MWLRGSTDREPQSDGFASFLRGPSRSRDSNFQNRRKPRRCKWRSVLILRIRMLVLPTLDPAS
jgi:hypothetical protein